MPWVRIDDQMPQHPKVVGIGPLGLALHVAGLCYCNRYLTDGFIPASAAITLLDFTELDEHAFNGRGNVCRIAIDKLLDAGVWIEIEGGFSIHDYLDYQPSRAHVEAERAQKQAAGQAGGQASAKARAAAESKQNPTPNPNPNPVPMPISQTIEKEAPAVPCVLPEWVSEQVWADYLDMRKKKRAKPTYRAMELVIGELGKLKEAGNDPNAILRQSIMNNWTGVFPLRDKGSNNGTARAGARFANDHDKYVEAAKSDIG